MDSAISRSGEPLLV